MKNTKLNCFKTSSHKQDQNLFSIVCIQTSVCER